MPRTIQAQEVNPDVILQSGQPAPFMGVLVNQNNYRTFTIAKREADNFRDNLDSEVKCPTEVPTVSVFSSGDFEIVIGIGFLAFVGGFLIGTNHH